MCHVIRFIMEHRLNDYFNEIKYVDNEQGERIETHLREISNELRLILNNIKRIGVNYNQEVRFKNAEQKFKTLSDDVSVPLAERTKALEEYNRIKREMNDSGLDMDELKNVLAAFEKVTTRMEDMLCLIQE